MSITIDQVTLAVEAALGEASLIARTGAEGTITEGVNDLPYMMIYAESGQTDPKGGVDRTSFRGGIRVNELIVMVDVYVRQRSHIGEDMAKTTHCTDAVINILEEQNVKPYFGLLGLQAFHWAWQRVTFVYGDPNTGYVGVRFTLTFTIF